MGAKPPAGTRGAYYCKLKHNDAFPRFTNVPALLRTQTPELSSTQFMRPGIDSGGRGPRRCSDLLVTVMINVKRDCTMEMFEGMKYSH